MSSTTKCYPLSTLRNDHVACHYILLAHSIMLRPSVAFFKLKKCHGSVATLEVKTRRIDGYGKGVWSSYHLRMYATSLVKPFSLCLYHVCHFHNHLCYQGTFTIRIKFVCRRGTAMSVGWHLVTCIYKSELFKSTR